MAEYTEERKIMNTYKMRNILVRTTFKDDLILLKAFYKFYSAIWNPQTFIFYVGYSRYDEAKIINDINESLNIKISYRQDSTELNTPLFNLDIITLKFESTGSNMVNKI